MDWAVVYADQLPRLYNYFRFRLGSDIDAEDLTSRTFLKAWEARDRYRRDLAGFSTWLFRIAQNLCVDHFRSRRIHSQLETASDLPDPATPESDAARASDLRHLAELAMGLSEREREVARGVLEGRTHREIGAELFISAKTVEHHVARVRQKLGATTRAELLAAIRDELAAAAPAAGSSA